MPKWKMGNIEIVYAPDVYHVIILTGSLVIVLIILNLLWFYIFISSGSLMIFLTFSRIFRDGLSLPSSQKFDTTYKLEVSTIFVERFVKICVAS